MAINHKIRETSFSFVREIIFIQSRQPQGECIEYSKCLISIGRTIEEPLKPKNGMINGTSIGHTVGKGWTEKHLILSSKNRRA